MPNLTYHYAKFDVDNAKDAVAIAKNDVSNAIDDVNTTFRKKRVVNRHKKTLLEQI